MATTANEELTGETLRRILQEQPNLKGAQIAKMFRVSRQWVWTLAKQEGLRLAGSQRKWVEGL